ncbi:MULTISPECIES: Na+/H+ antiporter subunit D [Pseudovibrio]|uniref:Na+/H+ antiporter subunit D n=1 Tax=Stappiaceae TaxID=2821832 RepID=UPI002366D70A|nr:MULTISPECIES: Na+/H+ antiporter subunit D [Pseudovibrio]MDD7909171.1 Na+/H+ antiporter subunit D [Pseudovibrio exalbescens]MDX5595616.1 Na+/H+ antiporter subunit D [Pseudovibrio sp. SPO723]
MAVSSNTVDIAAAMVTQPVQGADWLLVTPLLLTMAGGAVAIMLRKKTAIQPWIAIGVISLVVLSNIGLLAHVLDHGVVTMVMGGWLPPFGIAFTADAMGAFFALSASIVALCAAIYAAGSIEASERRYGFYPFLILLLCGCTGAFLTGDIFNLYVWFEVLLISAVGMIVLGNDKAQIDGGVKYAILNFVATTLFLMATGLLYGLVGTLNMADIIVKVSQLEGQGPIYGIAAIYFLAFAMKAAAFPVNFWLPASYHTPRMVVSAVFGGLLTKVGVYALLRVVLMLMPEPREWLGDIISLVAIATMIAGALGALAQTDIRRMTGYIVISGVGSMIAGLAIANQVAVAGAIFYAVHSFFCITALYLLAGVINRIGGSFSLRELGGLYNKSPLVAAVSLILLLAVAGLPPFSGLWPKVMLVEGALESGRSLLAASILISGILLTIAIGRYWIYAFWRGGPEGTVDGTLVPQSDGTATVASVSLPMTVTVPMAILTGLVIYLGLFPEGVMAISTQGAASLVDPTAYVQSVFGVWP